MRSLLRGIGAALGRSAGDGPPSISFPPAAEGHPQGRAGRSLRASPGGAIRRRARDDVGNRSAVGATGLAQLRHVLLELVVKVLGGARNGPVADQEVRRAVDAHFFGKGLRLLD